MFDAVLIPTCFIVESEAVAVPGRLQPRRSIDEKHGVIHEIFLTEFREEQLGQRVCSRE
jgi:hypothetical protein